MKISIVVLISVVLCSFLSCKRICYDEPLTIKRENFSSEDFRSDGYYYALTGYTYTKEAIYNIYIFYNNGILFNTSSSDLKYTESVFLKSDWAHNKFGWGLFSKQSNTLYKVQYWLPKQCGLPYVDIDLNIINDTTFYESMYSDTFHFKQFYPKPDSTNNFIN